MMMVTAACFAPSWAMVMTREARMQEGGVVTAYVHRLPWMLLMMNWTKVRRHNRLNLSSSCFVILLH